MQKIEITEIPGGQAPEVIRQAWVGLQIPTDPAEEQPAIQQTGGAITRGERPVPKLVYSVFAKEAFDLLEVHNNGAYRWWQSATPHLFQPGMHLLFDAAACRVVNE